MTEYELLALAAAVHNHLTAHAGKPMSAKQIHALWNEWPAIEAPLQHTLDALNQLEIDGEIERLLDGSQEKWRLSQVL